MIPMVDLQRQYLSLRTEIEAALNTALAKAQYVLGPNVTAFEREAAEYLGVKYAISCASGTDALHLALRAAGIGPGDEVITSTFSFIGSAEAICYTGATPVLVDICADTFNIDPAAAAAAITPRTRAIMPVHLFGQPADIASIQALCERHQLIMIEDCAQSFGASIGGRKTGSFGDLGCFSFFPSKNLGCFGDGGLITCRDAQLAKRCHSLRNHGSQRRYYHDEIGYNSRLDELQAVVLRVKLGYIEQYNAARRAAAQRYNAALAAAAVQTPREDGLGTHIYHQYTLLSERREDIAAALRDNDIASAIYYPVPLHLQRALAPAGEDSAAVGTRPNAERSAAQCLSLPIYPELSTTQIDQISAVVTAVPP